MPWFSSIWSEAHREKDAEGGGVWYEEASCVSDGTAAGPADCLRRIGKYRIRCRRDGRPKHQHQCIRRFQNAKLIHTAHLEVETTAFDAAAADLETLVGELGGYFEYAAVNSYSSGYRSGTYTVRVPTGQFEVFLDQVGELCHVVYQEKDSENISEAYYDTESRLVTQKTKLERLQELLGQAETMEDIITIESAISETELAIEQLTGTLRSYDALVDFATVHLAYGWVWVLLLAVIVAAVVRILRKRRPETGDRPEKPWHTKK